MAKHEDIPHFGKFKVKPEDRLDLGRIDPDDTSDFDGDEEDAKKLSKKIDQKLDQLQEMLYAGHEHKFLIILQALDTGGKDGVIRRVFQGISPSGIRVVHFRQPTLDELDHGFLWKPAKNMPAKGEIVIFNRSYYESVLVERVHKIVPEEIWRTRYEEIREFERILNKEGTTIVKFYLHISSKEQKKRLQERLEDPTKEWKFSETDLRERKLWPEYMKAYKDCLENTSTEFAPWYVVPANHKWYRDLVVASVLVRALEKLDMRYPTMDKKVRATVVK